MKNKTIDRLMLARRIRAAGRPIYIAEDDDEACGIPSDGLRVNQFGGVNESSVVAITKAGGIAVTIYLCITNYHLPHFAISAFGLELPWPNDSFWWLPDPLEIYGGSQCYKFGAKGFPEFERSEVLNHLADERRTYSPGRSVKGALLGFGLDSIPEQFRHGEMILAFVIICDQFSRKYRSPVQLWLDRSLTRSAVPRKHRGLFGRPDRGFGGAPLEKEDDETKI
jgi:hypothetical protein